MSFFKKREVVAQPPNPETRKILRLYQLRPGMWVSYKGVPAIITGISGELDGFVKIMLTDSKFGLNKEEIRVSTNELRQAKYEEIPEGRRPERDLARRMGYM